MKKGIVVALAVTGSLVAGPAALAATAEPSGFLSGTATPQHSGHDHGKKSDHDKHGKSKKDGHGHHGGHGHGHGGHGHHGHGHGHHHHHHGDDGAHASGGYDSHRSHPRQHAAPIVLTSAPPDVLDHGQESADDDHDHDGDGKPDHDPEDHDKDEPKPKPKPKPGS